MEIGAQLYSVRSYLDTFERMDETFARLKQMGYGCVQLSGHPEKGERGAGFNVEEINRLIDKHELPVRLTHVSSMRLENDLDRVIADHKAIGCSNIGIGEIPGAFNEDFALDEKNIKAFINRYESIANKIADAGLKFFYHNHHFDFCKMENGKVIIDYLLAECPHFNFTLDTHWIQRGGASITQYIKKMQGKVECVHLKDFLLSSKKTARCNRLEPMFMPVGEGVLDWKSILKEYANSGTKYAFVEQDDAVDYDNPFSQLEISINNLKKIGY